MLTKTKKKRIAQLISGKILQQIDAGGLFEYCGLSEEDEGHILSLIHEYGEKLLGSYSGMSCTVEGIVRTVEQE
ncbi:hypothetical protein DNI29_19065 [Hymenobacter sediminis]|uniref:hypothetical protein n=1 Tax=Hymenobacter sediminis TaxID=2218621 RepID=UPI000DA650F1|nr:hypothetical protein [Hymenobacter sediminis]RPD45483.1 hypothetical protein DNI29_19065 [Hymenobacter sediminis]